MFLCYIAIRRALPFKFFQSKDEVEQNNLFVIDAAKRFDKKSTFRKLGLVWSKLDVREYPIL